MTIVYADLKPDVLKRAGDRDGDTHSSADVERYLNISLDQLCLKSGIFVKHTAVDYNLGQFYVNLPDDFVKDLLFYFNNIPVTYKPPLQDDSGVFTGSSQSLGTTFSRYYILGSKLRIFPALNVAEDSSTLNGAVSSTDTTITLASVSGFNSRGVVKIDSELIEYNGVDTTLKQLLYCHRGFGYTTATTHADLSTVTEKLLIAVYIAKHPKITEAGNEPLLIPEYLRDGVVEGAVKYLYKAQGRETEYQVSETLHRDAIAEAQTHAAHRNNQILSIARNVSVNYYITPNDPRTFRMG